MPRRAAVETKRARETGGRHLARPLGIKQKQGIWEEEGRSRDGCEREEVHGLEWGAVE
jgi:hypothetical protein